MKPHTSAEVDGLRDYVNQYLENPPGEEYEEFYLDCLRVQYHTVHLSEAEQPFPYAALSKVVNEADYEIEISDDVPEDLRGLWAWQELRSLAIVGPTAHRRCLQTEMKLKNVIEKEGSAIYQKYVEYRVDYYEYLADYMEEQIAKLGGQSPYSVSDVAFCDEARLYLEGQQVYEHALKTKPISGRDIRKFEATVETCDLSVMDLGENGGHQIDDVDLQEVRTANFHIGNSRRAWVCSRRAINLTEAGYVLEPTSSLVYIYDGVRPLETPDPSGNFGGTFRYREYKVEHNNWGSFISTTHTDRIHVVDINNDVVDGEDEEDELDEFEDLLGQNQFTKADFKEVMSYLDLCQSKNREKTS